MPRPEEFRDHLKEKSKELRQKARIKTKQAKKKRRQEQKREKKRQKQEHLNQQKINKQRRLEVNKLDSQLSIGKYIKTLKSQLRPLSRVRKWKSGEGQIAYAFPYNSGFKKWEGGGHEISFRTGGRTPVTSGYTNWHEMFAIILSFDGNIDIRIGRCAFENTSTTAYYKKIINPLGSHTRHTYPDSLGTLNITSEEGLGEFTQILTNFYNEQKAKG